MRVSIAGWVAALIALLFHIGLASWLMSLTPPAKTQPVELLSMEWVDSPAPEPVIEPTQTEPLVSDMEAVAEPEPVLVSKAVAPPPPPPKPVEPKPVTKPVKPVVSKVPVSQPTPEVAPANVTEPAPSSPKATASEVLKPLVKAQADYLNNPKPSYPRLSKRMGEQGEVRLRVDIAADGSVTHVALAKSSGFERLDEAAITAVKSWAFKPAKQGDVSVASTVEIPVKFMLEDE